MKTHEWIHTYEFHIWYIYGIYTPFLLTGSFKNLHSGPLRSESSQLIPCPQVHEYFFFLMYFFFWSVFWHPIHTNSTFGHWKGSVLKRNEKTRHYSLFTCERHSILVSVPTSLMNCAWTLFIMAADWVVIWWSVIAYLIALISLCFIITECGLKIRKHFCGDIFKNAGCVEQIYYYFLFNGWQKYPYMCRQGPSP